MHGGGRRSSAVTYLPGFLSLALLLLVVAHVASAFLRPPAHAIAPRGSVLRPRPLPFVAVHHPTRAAAAAAIDSTTEAVAAEEEEEDWARSELSPGKRERRKRKAQRLSKGGGGGGIQGDQGRVEPSENKRAMDELHVKLLPGEAELEISFFDLDGKLCQLRRPKGEPAGAGLRRLAQRIVGKGGGGGGGAGGKGGKKQAKKNVISMQAQLHIKLLDLSAASSADPPEIDSEATAAAEAWGFLLPTDDDDDVTGSDGESQSLFAGKGRELVILRGQAGVQEWEALQQGGGAGAGDGEVVKGGARHVLRYRVVRNPPGITELRFAAKLMMADFPVAVLPTTVFASGVNYRWQYEEGDGRWAPFDASDPEGPDSEVVYPQAPRHLSKRLRVFCTPYRQDGPDVVWGRTITCYSPKAVLAPGPQPWLTGLRVPEGEARLAPTSAEDGRVRIACYNILADNYASSAWSKKHLYPYVKPEHLSSEYRTLLALRELTSYGPPDLTCLQEVDERVFRDHLQPVLGAAGLSGRFRSKCGSTREGAAVFWRRGRFELISQHGLDLRDAFKREDCPFKALQARYPALRTVLQEKLTTTGQILLLRMAVPDGPPKLVLLGNTHLFYHPKAQHIRLMQAYTLLKEMERRQDVVEAQHGARPLLVLCGDLNSVPGTAAIRMLLGEGVPNTDPVWAGIGEFGWGRRGEGLGLGDEEGEGGDGEQEAEQQEQEGADEDEDEVVLVEDRDLDADQTPGEGEDAAGAASSSLARRVEEVHIHHHHHHQGEEEEDEDEEVFKPDLSVIPPVLAPRRPFKSACGIPDFTNFVQGFVETLDYILIEDTGPSSSSSSGGAAGGAEVLSVSRMPIREEAAQDVALPSWRTPSDHVSLLCDVRMR